MSVFEAGTEQQTKQVTEQETQTEESWIKKLVEKRGEQWSDPEVIAKGKWEADEYISNLERQLEEAREDISKNEYAKTLLETIQEKQGGAVGTPNPEDTSTNTAEQDTTVSASELETLVEEALTKRESTRTSEQNIASVDTQLSEVYGDKASEVVVSKAKELGLSLDRMKEIAAESPSAFMRLVTEKNEQRGVRPSSSVNTQSNAFNSSSEKNWAYYQKMRRENSKLYYTPKVQQELLDQRVSMGSNFYNN